MGAEHEVVRAVEPDPDTTCTFTAVNRTVGLPPTPLETYVGASTGVPLLHEGDEPVPPDTTACPAVVGTHSHPGVTTAHAPDTTQPNTTVAPSTTRTIRHPVPISTSPHFEPNPGPALVNRGYARSSPNTSGGVRRPGSALGRRSVGTK
jgi:hypothetical protein